MEVTDLMIGDWVDRFNKSPYYKVIAINNVTTEVCISETGEDDDTERIVWDDKLDPIPLTPEILEKNGAHKNRLMGEQRHFEYCLDGFELLAIYDADFPIK